MNLEMLHVADAVAREKSVERELVLEAMEQALATAARRTYGNKHVRASIDRETGDISLTHVHVIVEEVEDEDNELTLDAAAKINAELKLGDEICDSLPPIELGRIAAQTAKQVINQKIREAERERVIAEYEPRIGELISGIVKRVERGNVYVDLGRGEAVMYREDLLPRETYRQGDRVRGYLREVRDQSKGPLVFLSRSDAGMVQRLFEQEVPEIQDGIVEIQAIARDPGSRTKIAVISNDPSIDPVGTCVGMRGARVQAIVNELHGEKIDIIEWTPDTAAFVINALAPANIVRVVVDEENQNIEVAVAEDQLAIAIGRRGQNVRLASELTGWNIEIMSAADERQKRESEIEKACEVFKQALDVDEGLASLLCTEGFFSLEDLAYCPIEELAAIQGFETELAQELQSRARNTLLDKAMAQEGDAGQQAQPPLLDLPGMTETIANELAGQGITTVEALADIAVDDIVNSGNFTHGQIEALIIAAREASGWFD